MTLPDTCPRDGETRCKKKTCHLYVVDWRTGDEQCIIGYVSTHKVMSKSDPVIDTYAQDTRKRIADRKGQQIQDKDEDPVAPSADFDQKKELHLSRTKQYTGKTSEDVGQKANSIDPLYEEVTVNTRNAIVTESRRPVKEPMQKRKSLDDVMKLDLPDNYEEEFWKK